MTPVLQAPMRWASATIEQAGVWLLLSLVWAGLHAMRRAGYSL